MATRFRRPCTSFVKVRTGFLGRPASPRLTGHPGEGGPVSTERPPFAACLGSAPLGGPAPARRDDPPAVGAVREPDPRVSVAFPGEALPGSAGTSHGHPVQDL